VRLRKNSIFWIYYYW